MKTAVGIFPFFLPLTVGSSSLKSAGTGPGLEVEGKLRLRERRQRHVSRLDLGVHSPCEELRKGKKKIGEPPTPRTKKKGWESINKNLLKRTGTLRQPLKRLEKP